MSNVLIIGASRGIGLEWAKQFSNKGANLYATCRQPTDQLRSLKNTQIISDIDVRHDECITQLKRNKQLPDKIDVCIYNSGIMYPEMLRSLNKTDSILEQFNVNSVGPLRISKALIDTKKLQKGSKYCIMTGIIGSIAEPTPVRGMYGYRMSKCSANMAGHILANDLKNKKIAVGMFHPGYVRTDMTKGSGAMEADEAVEAMMGLVDGLNMENSGSFWHSNGKILPW